MLNKYLKSFFFLLPLLCAIFLPTKVFADSTHVTASSYDIPYQAYKDVTFTLSNSLNEDFHTLSVNNSDANFNGNNVTLPLTCVGTICTATNRYYGNNYGNWPIQYTISDSNNIPLYTESDSTQFTVLNLPVPTISPIVGPTDPVLINTSQNFSATFSNTLDSGPHTAQWNWGDGTYTYGTVIIPL